MKIKQIARIGAGIACFAVSLYAHPQAYPAKPVRAVLTLSGTDFLARHVAQKMSDAFGQPVVVDMVLGASGAIGAATVARAAPDGYTILLASSAQIVTRTFLSKDTPYDSVKSFTPIAKIAEAVAVVAVNPALPANSMKELIDYTRSNPGKVYFGSSGIGTTHHLSAEMVRQLTDVKWTHVPYKGGRAVGVDLLSGRIQVAFASLTNVVQFAKEGKLRIVGINADSRFRIMPDVPTVAEQLPGYERPPGWVAYFGPAGMPSPIVNRLNEEIGKALADPELRAKFEGVGFILSTSSPDELGDMVKKGVAITGKLIKAAGIQPR